MSHALIFQVSALISTGAILSTQGYAVGAQVPGGGRFVCLDRRGQVVESLEAWDETTSDGRPHDRRGNGCVWVTKARQDWTSYGAARAFVTACKAANVERAIKEARGQRR